MRFGVLVFPGTWSETDCYYAVRDTLGEEGKFIWHKEHSLSDIDCLILPGGFSYGDYLRPGAIARFSPIMPAVVDFANNGGLIIGICNGFQILCEAGLLPGTLVRNEHLQFRCQWVNLRVENTRTPFTNQMDVGDVLQIPISHGDGNYYADETTLSELNQKGQIIFRYCDPNGSLAPQHNPNGSKDYIAGIINEAGNVLGMMPHPERAMESILGGSDGLAILKSIVYSFTNRTSF
jgi:phosphoribosylformylglycinamidine synthase